MTSTLPKSTNQQLHDTILKNSKLTCLATPLNYSFYSFFTPPFLPSPLFLRITWGHIGLNKMKTFWNVRKNAFSKENKTLLQDFFFVLA